MGTALSLDGVTVRRRGRPILDAVTLTIAESERWVVMGPNGAGKTTLMLVASGRLFPTEGIVTVLDEELGATSVHELRTRIGWASGHHAADFPPGESVHDVVLTGAQAVTGRWREEYDEVDDRRAAALLGSWGLAPLARRTFGTLSEGERKRCLIARALMADPELLLLDEPAAGLDLGGREDLVDRLGLLATDMTAPTQVLVTHHVEEIPRGFTHGLLLRDGRVVASGPLAEVITPDALGAAFGMRLVVRHEAGRWSARRAG